MSAPTSQAQARLRAWAAGDLALEAATELMIAAFNGRFALRAWPWMHPTAHGQWIDFSTIPVQIGALSGGEQRLLRIAASIGSPHTTVNLNDCLTGLDPTSLQLVLKAVAHAGGDHSGNPTNPKGRASLTTGTTKALVLTSVPTKLGNVDAAGSKSL